MALFHPPSQSNPLLLSLVPALRAAVDVSPPPPLSLVALVALVASLSLPAPLPTLECYELLVADDPMALVTTTRWDERR